MISKTTTQLKQDLSEVKSKLEDLQPIAANCSEYKNLKDWFEILEEHLKDHIETIENFICDIK